MLVEKVDQFTAEIVRAALVATTDEMKTNLKRTAYNAIVYEAQDFTVALTDAEGNLTSIGMGLPSFIRGISDTVKAMIRFHGSDIHPGDILMTNDAYTHGSHLPHVITAVPIFADGEIVSFAASEPHWGSWGGLLGANPPDIFAMGLQIPHIKIYKRGVLDKEKLAFVSMNIRNPDRGMGDFRGQIACIKTGEKRILHLTNKYGKEAYKAALRRIADQADTFSRREIDAIPEGTYEAEQFLDDDGIDIGKHITIKVKVTVNGDRMTVDLSGMGKQVRGHLNSRAGVTGVQMGFKTVVCPTWYPVNDGSFRPLKVVLPEGTVVSAAKPAPIGSWMIAPMSICDTIWKALQTAAPERIAGGHHASLAGASSNPIDPATGRPIVLRAAVGGNAGGGFGAVYDADGQCTTICMNDGDLYNQPVESGEAADASGLVVRYELRQDSGGPGKFRGGLGGMREIVYFREGMVNNQTERSMCPPFGALGGKPGKANAYTVSVPLERNPPELMRSNEILAVPRRYTHYPNPGHPNLKIVGERFPAGFTVTALVGGGGGYGNPLDRDPKRVLDDAFNGYISLESARDDYGVVIETRDWTVDRRATEALRQRAQA